MEVGAWGNKQMDQRVGEKENWIQTKFQHVWSWAGRQIISQNPKRQVNPKEASIIRISCSLGTASPEKADQKLNSLRLRIKVRRLISAANCWPLPS